MTIWTDFLVLLLVAAAVAGIIGLAMKKRWARYDATFTMNGFIMLFITVFLGAWLISSWVAGPLVYGLAWFPFLWAAIIIGFFVLLFAPPRRGAWSPEKGGSPAASRHSWLVTDIYFWTALLVLMLLIAWGYVLF